ncbi:MAG: hypothetical protein GYA14_15865 [Ignavibacteria bacterium]|nr:hypothetical protein [Ignavibacteria bacterium]
MKISILNSFGADLQEWSALEQDLLELLKSNYGIFLNEDDCGHYLKDVLTEDDLMAIATIMAEKNHAPTLNILSVQELGYASTYHNSILLGEFMLVGDGECPFCGSNYITEHDGPIVTEYDGDETRLRDKCSYITKICQSCGHEWSPED